LVENQAIPISLISRMNSLNPRTFEKQYKDKLSDFNEWVLENDSTALVYPENFGEKMSIDETALSDGELYTIITNKQNKGRKGSLAAIIKGTKNEVVSKALEKVPISKLYGVKSITADLANSMDWICRTNFKNSVIVADRFHVQQIISEAVQEIRISYRRKAIDEGNLLIKESKIQKIPYQSFRYFNGDTKKQLLARGRYILFKPESKWTKSQKERSEILFKNYPEIKSAYNLSMYFRNIFENSKTTEIANIKFREWFLKIDKSEIPTLISAKETIKNNIGKILNYFIARETNASAESFNAKIKQFRALVRGVRDIKFFLFRIEKLYA